MVNIRHSSTTALFLPGAVGIGDDHAGYYVYPEPEGIHPFSLTSELSVCPWNKEHHLLLVGLKGRSIDKSSLPPSNIVFLIDVSGSMNSPDKLPLLKSAFGLLVNELRPRDRVAMMNMRCKDLCSNRLRETGKTR